MTILGLSALAMSGVYAQYQTRNPPVSEPSSACGTFNYERTALGPLDYRTAHPDAIDIVETRHFTENVERLVRGERGTLGGDIAYTLRVFPNHPRALRSAAELTRRNGGRMPKDLNYNVSCWFDRAIAYRPDDAQVRVLWAFELVRSQNTSAALDQTKLAESLAKGNANLHYNVGLLYFELKEYGKALENAKIAYDQGFNLPGLRDKLTKAGKWGQ